MKGGESMLDVLQLRINPDEFEQLRYCQIGQRNDCHAAFTVKAAEVVWPVASWDEMPVAERINVRGWFPLLDKIADEFLLWWPQGGCFFVDREVVTNRLHEQDTSGVLFLQLEVNRMKVVPKPQGKKRVRDLVPQII
jgi:hypothetical protein